MQFAGLSLSRILKKSIISKARTVGHVMFNKYLLYTNLGISVTLSGVGDTLEQHYEILEGDHDKWDRVRTLHMSVTGLTAGLLCHNTYRYLDLIFPGRAVKAVLKKVLIDQVVVSPVAISVFFVTLAVLERSSVETLRQEIAHKGWRLYVAECIVWPPAQLFNFFVLPPRFRVLYDNTISVGFDVYASRVKHDSDLVPASTQDVKDL